eukprot:3940764-Rhodomonas_salina.4
MMPSPTPLRAYYAVSGTDTALDAIPLCARYAMSGTVTQRVPGFVLATQPYVGVMDLGSNVVVTAQVLLSAYAMPGTDILYDAVGILGRDAMSLRECYAMSGTGLVRAAVCLRSCYAVSGTGLAYSPTQCLAMSGTALAYTDTGFLRILLETLAIETQCVGTCQVNSATSLRASYAMSGTGIAYASTSLRASYAMSYAMSGSRLTSEDMKWDHTVIFLNNPPPLGSVLYHTVGGLISEHHGRRMRKEEDGEWDGRRIGNEIVGG